MVIGNWIHRLFNPHCPHCKEEREDSKVCASCETLKHQLEISNLERNRLMDRLLAKPEPEVPREFKEVTNPKNVPWNVRRQMLESEDRERAKLMRAAPIPTEDLERELEVASEKRENER